MQNPPTFLSASHFDWTDEEANLRCPDRPRSLPELHGQFGGPLFAGIDHIDRTAIPRMFERKRDDFPDADEPQPEFDVPAEILKAGLGNRLKSSLVALSSNERDKCLLDARGP